MTGEELNRKYHELKGWPKRSGELLACPPLHLDANLAIAEAEKVMGDFIIDRMNECYRVSSVSHREEYTFADASLCEAILKALIAAGGK